MKNIKHYIVAKNYPELVEQQHLNQQLHNGPHLSSWIQTNVFINHAEENLLKKCVIHEYPVWKMLKFYKSFWVCINVRVKH